MKDVRPTSGKVLQAMFNIIGEMDGLCFLDLFSGTGRISLEAWSRGARKVVSVELIRKRSSLIKIPRDVQDGREFIVLTLDVRRALKWLVKKNFSFDIVFADPPYNGGWPSKIVELVCTAPGLIAKGGHFILEHTDREPLHEMPQGWLLVDQRKYGGTLLSILSKSADREAE